MWQYEGIAMKDWEGAIHLLEEYLFCEEFLCDWLNEVCLLLDMMTAPRPNTCPVITQYQTQKNHNQITQRQSLSSECERFACQ
jgi:hypothetical protein